MDEEQLRFYLDQHYDEFAALLQEEYLTPAFTSQLQDQLRPYFDQYFDEFINQIPSELSADESTLPPGVMTNVSLARQYLGYFQTGYIALIGFMVLLVLLIILIYRSVRDSTRALGIDLLVSGVLELAGVYLARSFIPINQMLTGLPPSLQSWLEGLFVDFFAPLQMFSLGVLIAGIVLLIVSFVYKPATAED